MSRNLVITIIATRLLAFERLNLGLVHQSLVLVKLTLVATHVATARKITITIWVSSTSCRQNACRRAVNLVHTILKYSPRKDDAEP